MIEPVPLGRSDARVSRFALGLWRLAQWNLDSVGLLELIEGALDLGITTFDHADIYGEYTCEERFGKALARSPALRGRMQLIGKCGIKLVSSSRPQHGIKHYDTSALHIVRTVEHSLRMLRTDHLDLLLIHRPDPLLDADEVAAAFAELRRDGKVLHFGASNFEPSQFDLLASRCEGGLVANQIEISALQLEPFLDGSLDHCQRRRVTPMAWSPLGGGRLFDASDVRAGRVRAALAAIAETNGAGGIDEVAYAWLLTHPSGIVPLLGTGRIDRLHAAAAATELELSREQWFSVWIASSGAGVP